MQRTRAASFGLCEWRQIKTQIYSTRTQAKSEIFDYIGLKTGVGVRWGLYKPGSDNRCVKQQTRLIVDAGEAPIAIH